MSALPEPASLLPLSEPVFHILLALVDRPRHGYAIMRQIDERTAGSVRIGPGTLYGAIKRLRAQSLVEEVGAEQSDGEPDAASDERRRYYRLTERGLEVARLEVSRLERLLASARTARLARRTV